MSAMEIIDKLKCLYDGDTKNAYAALRELEALSEHENILYPYVDKFIAMLKSEKYVVRVRGFRLLCKQAKWDRDNKINKAIDDILHAVHDEKPTAVRQVLQYLKFIVSCKKELHAEIKQAVLSIDCSRFKDSMRPLITKDITHLLQLIDKK